MISGLIGIGIGVIIVIVNFIFWNLLDYIINQFIQVDIVEIGFLTTLIIIEIFIIYLLFA